MPLPAGVQTTLGGGPHPSHGDRPHQPSSAEWEGQPSPCRHQACILGLQMNMCCPRVTRRAPPSPGTKLPCGSTPLLPRLPVSPRPPPQGVICSAETPSVPSCSLNESSKVLKLHEKGRGWAGPGGHNARLGASTRTECPLFSHGPGVTPPAKPHSSNGAVAGGRASPETMPRHLSVVSWIVHPNSGSEFSGMCLGQTFESWPPNQETSHRTWLFPGRF